MAFANWLEDHLVPRMLVPSERWNGRTVRLVEEGVMEISVEDVPRGSFVVRFDKGIHGYGRENERLIKADKGLNINWRCDYLILEESNTKYTVTFIELKRSLNDYDSHDEVDLKGEEQLLWSLSGLKHLLAIFETDMYTAPHDREIQVRYFLVANNKSPWYRKRTSRGGFVQRNHKGIQINYMATDRTNMRNLKARDSTIVLRH